MSLRTFRAFQQQFLPQSLKGKIMLVAFIGTHIPLLGLLGYLLWRHQAVSETMGTILITLAATVIGMLATLGALHCLLKPIEKTSVAISGYLNDRKVPDLPTNFDDEAGQLMANTQHFIERLDQLLALNNDLISIISHDARTPVTSIMIAEELIQKELREDDINRESISKNARAIRKSAEQHLETLENLLEMTKLKSRDFDITMGDQRIEPILDEIEDTQAMRAQAQNISLNFTTCGIGESTFQLDRPKVVSILNNLVSNAIKFTPPGGTIDVNASVEDQQLRLTVSDTGQGIPESDLDDIFSREYTKPSPYEDKSGSGLGLRICRAFAEVHGGSIEVESTPDVGTTFRVVIPAK
jgi:signal transduction histidine kinase